MISYKGLKWKVKEKFSVYHNININTTREL